MTKHITLPDRHLILLPNSNYIGVSKKIEDESTRNDLVNAAKKVKPESMKDMGNIMKELKPLVNGKADMKLVNTIVKEKLS